MSRKIVTVGEDAPLEEAVRLMEYHHVKRLPVVKNGAVIGIISRGNLLHAFVVATSEPPSSGAAGAGS
jgi:CBS domain-containing protein